MSDVFEGATPRVEDLVGEGKKYATPEKALESLPHKEVFIEDLKRQVAELREELSKAKTIDAVLDELKVSKETGTTNLQEPKIDTEGLYKELEAKLQQAVQSRVQERVQEEVPKVLSAASEQQVRRENRQAVSNAITSAFGATAPTMLAERAKELGMTVEDLGKLSETSPKAVLAFFQVQGSSGATSVRTDSMSSTGSREGTYAHYNELRKKDPTKYFTPKIQQQLLKDRMRLGEDFYK